MPNGKTYEDYFNEAVATDEPVVSEKEKIEVKEDQTPKEDEVKKEDEDPITKDDKKVDEEEPTGFTPVETDDTKPKGEESEINWEERYNESVAENQRLQHKMSSWEGRIRKANERAASAEAKIEELLKKHEEPAKKTDTPDVDGDKVLSEFMEEFPDLVEPIKRLATNIADKIVSERLGTVTPQIEEIKKSQKQSAEDAFLAPITEAHPDWRSIYDSGQLQAWIDKQPPLQQKVLNTIVTDGNQEEVIDMFTAYKKANGIIKKEDPQPKPTGEDNPDMKNIIAVRGRSAGPPVGKPDKNDFESAWKEATSS